jgi:DNA-binding GntR family transcriptional regulator
MGISRAPLREALRKLEEEGLVTKIAFRGSFVTEVGPQVIEEIATLRRVVEPFAVTRGLSYLRGEGRPRLEQAMADLNRTGAAGDITGTGDAHLALHRLVYESANHKILLDLWNGWQSQLKLFLAVDLQSFENPAAVARAHVRLVDIMLNGTPKAIRDELVDHIHGAAPEGGSNHATASKPRARKAAAKK